MLVRDNVSPYFYQKVGSKASENDRYAQVTVGRGLGCLATPGSCARHWVAAAACLQCPLSSASVPATADGVGTPWTARRRRNHQVLRKKPFRRYAPLWAFPGSCVIFQGSPYLGRPLASFIRGPNSIADFLDGIRPPMKLKKIPSGA